MADTDIDPNRLPNDLPMPQDDGGADHLTGRGVADIDLTATSGAAVNLAKLSGRTVLYIYPRTGVPGIPNPGGWDLIPGARGCTPQSCSFRDHFDELRRLGADCLFGLSTQDTEYQREAATRLHLPFALLSDARLDFTRAMSLPTFKVDGMTLVKRMTLIIDAGMVVKVFYPVFPPDKNAAMVIDWLQASR